MASNARCTSWCVQVGSYVTAFFFVHTLWLYGQLHHANWTTLQKVAWRVLLMKSIVSRHSFNLLLIHSSRLLVFKKFPAPYLSHITHSSLILSQFSKKYVFASSDALARNKFLDFVFWNRIKVLGHFVNLKKLDSLKTKGISKALFSKISIYFRFCGTIKPRLRYLRC